MSNLIPADKLISEIERLAKSYQDPTFITVRGNTANNFRDNLLSFITSLQQEEEEYLEEEIDKEWKKCNPIDEGMGVEMAYIHIEAFDIIARHFYELGVAARKEESVGVAESPLKTFQRVNDFECGGSYRH